MIHQPETLLLRIRAETLRLNLKRAHSNLKDLPSISRQCTHIQKCLSKILNDAIDISAKVGELRQKVLGNVMPKLEAVKDAQTCLDNLVSDLGTTKNELAKLGSKSFMVQVRAVGQDIWECLDRRASILQADVEEIENNISSPDAWNKLVKAEAEAREQVFNESVELLSGIALRDSRLDADICELAEGLIQSIRESGNYPSVIPGGISSMMITIDRIIRLRFPEWTVWALPFAAHEFWRVSVRKQFSDRLARSLGLNRLELIEVQRWIGDAFATYIMGPAYAYAAITLVFDPARAEDNLRVLATVGMLDPLGSSGSHHPATEAETKSREFSESYQTVKKELLLAWNAAKCQTGVTVAQSDATTTIEKAVAALFKDLKNFGYSYFDVAEWKSAGKLAKQLLGGAVDTIELSQKHDLRHVLNAAWLARLDAARTEDISKRATDLADRVKAELAKRSSDDAREPFRSLR